MLQKTVKSGCALCLGEDTEPCTRVQNKKRGSYRFERTLLNSTEFFFEVYIEGSSGHLFLFRA